MRMANEAEMEQIAEDTPRQMEQDNGDFEPGEAIRPVRVR